MKTVRKRHTADSLFSLLLLLIFSIFTLLLAGTGAMVYKNSAAKLDENYTSRTAVAYVSEKLRQNDRAGAVSFTEVEGCSALALQEDVEGESFVTYIYFYDGALRELFMRASSQPSAALGTAIVKLADFAVTQEDAMMRVTAISPDGNENSILLHVDSLPFTA